uniref:Uncharacterized protein n=1 Tax=Oryza sativa subsp. japonica TaxID=39947 RepID=Q5N758_ORYSJ|nr:hypothetical protein [Oryza sativa Japonica Group]
MGHPRLRAGPARPDSWWAVPGWEAQPMGWHGPARWLNFMCRNPGSPLATVKKTNAS